MSNSPLRPLAHPAQSRPPLTPQVTGLASSSASSSTTQPSRADQVVYRFYLKTIGILVEGRLTHYGGNGGKAERKKDKWFNLTLPEIDLYKPDLQIYRSISSYQTIQPAPADSDACAIPPLLVAFILDTSDLPSGQALIWNRGGSKVTIDAGLLGAGGKGKGKGKEKERNTGIILERWTFRASAPPVDQTPTTELPAHTAYRIGIIHFRALFALIRLLPAWRLFRRLRRANNGLRLGIKLWSPEGFSNSSNGLDEAWDIMERNLIPLDTGLEQLVTTDESRQEGIIRQDLPTLDLFGNEYHLGVEYRPEVDFHVEDMESVLSEKFVDMDEDWFTPTVARHRMEEEVKLSASNDARLRRISTSSAIPTTSPIPQRQQAANFGSLGTGSRPSGSRAVSGVVGSAKSRVGSVTDKWGALAEGLPFTATPSVEANRQPPSPGSVNTTGRGVVAARRLSGHSIQPFTSSASPSTSLLRSTPPLTQYQPQTPASLTQPVRPSSSIGRTSSFLSQSGRSFTHAQLANMYGTSASPPIITGGTMSGHDLPESPPPVHPPASPSSLSFTKQPIPRSSFGRPPYISASPSSPFLPGSLEGVASSSSPSAPAPLIKRYSSSLSQRPAKPLPTSSAPSRGSSGEGPSQPGSVGATGVSQGLLRRTSTRTSQESNLRYSAAAPGPDDAEIEAFLKTLDALPQPPSLAAQAIYASRSHLPSSSSSLSTPSVPPSPLPMQNSGGSPGTGVGGPVISSRTPLTRTQVDENLKRMAGSFNTTVNKFADKIAATSRPSSVAVSRTPSNTSQAPRQGQAAGLGLLSASRPNTTPRRVSQHEISDNQGVRPYFRRQTSGGSPLATTTTTPSTKLDVPISTDTIDPPTAVIPAITPKPPIPKTSPHARSLPGPTPTTRPPPPPDHLLPLRSAGPTPTLPLPSLSAGILTPQTTGGTSTTTESRTSRRGPVLLRGGFGEQQRSSKTSGGAGGGQSSSPSHSPIRDYGKMHREREKEREREREKERDKEDYEGVWRAAGFGTARTNPVRRVGSEASNGLPAGVERSVLSGPGVGVGGGVGGGVGAGVGRKEQRTTTTAPSSFGAEEGDVEEGGGGGVKGIDRGRVVSESGVEYEGAAASRRTLKGDW